jgi:hypothetical protein
LLSNDIITLVRCVFFSPIFVHSSIFPTTFVNASYIFTVRSANWDLALSLLHHLHRIHLPNSSPAIKIINTQMTLIFLAVNNINLLEAFAAAATKDIPEEEV